MSSRGSSNGGGVGIQAAIPSPSRKMVQSLREIVNCPEPEIYAMLSECNMDPNEAVSRLLSQDPFHEVKSKREKKKENKDTTESRSRGVSNTSSRWGKGGTDRYDGRSISTQYNYSDSGALHGRPAYKKENGTNIYASPSLVSSAVAGNNTSQQPPGHSNIVTTEYKASAVGASDGMSSLPSSGYQPSWSGVPGQVSMADIVKMGRPHGKASSTTNTSHYGVNEPHSNGSHCNVRSSEDYLSEPGVGNGQHVSPTEEWPLVEQPPTASVPPVLGAPVASQLHADVTYFSSNSIDQHPEPDRDEFEEVEDGDFENTSAISRKIEEDNSEGASLFNRDIYDNIGSYQPLTSGFERQEGSSLRFLLFPIHLTSFQLITVSQYHLTPEYYGDDSLKTGSDGNLVHRTGANVGIYESPSTSQSDMLKPENTEAPQEIQFSFPSSSSAYDFENGQQLNAPFPHSQTRPQMQSLAPFPSAYTNSLPSSLLAASAVPARDLDLTYSPFPMAQSLNAKYGSTPSSISGSTISVAEALKTAGFASTPQTTQAQGPALPQHLAAHPYSQPTLPLGPFANMIGYPFLPQNYTYVPPGFQQAFAENSTYHQSLAAVLPQYRNSISVSSLPQSNAVASGYGSVGNSTSIPGNFSVNLPAAPGPTSIGYDDSLSSQYKDNNYMLSLQQNENSGMWVHGSGSRTVSSVPASAYYNLQGQNQQPSGYRQTQQEPSHNYGAHSYPNFYYSHSGISLDHQQQNPRDGLLGSSQGQPSKQSQQMWQNGY
ncbi:hypothetical protein RHMOL_Rhmol13G0256400 [Rhododendron molle]|uniref:Uncharacterized protein n=1 Tax=Rhododendron molle TaxID=49168 RepID=A0ACC0LAN8_RHOML|nr:hypothetical protein RHMOL_Rhmol13G0256400 [Rhododendron molle]